MNESQEIINNEVQSNPNSKPDVLKDYRELQRKKYEEESRKQLEQEKLKKEEEEKQAELERQKKELEQQRLAEEKKQQEIQQIRDSLHTLSDIFKDFIIANSQKEFDNVNVGSQLHKRKLDDTSFFKILELVNCHSEFKFLASLLNDVANNHYHMIQATNGTIETQSYIKLSKSITRLLEYLKLVKSDTIPLENIHLKTITAIHQFKVAIGKSLTEKEVEIKEINLTLSDYHKELEKINANILAINNAPEDIVQEFREVQEEVLIEEETCAQRGGYCTDDCYHYSTKIITEYRTVEEAVLSEDQYKIIAALEEGERATQECVMKLTANLHLVTQHQKQLKPCVELLELFLQELMRNLELCNNILAEKTNSLCSSAFLGKLITLIDSLRKLLPELEINREALINLLVSLTLNENFYEFLQKIDKEFGEDGLEFLFETLTKIKSNLRTEENLIDSYIDECHLNLKLRQFNNSSKRISEISKIKDISFLAKLFNKIDNVDASNHSNLDFQKIRFLSECRIQGVSILEKEINIKVIELVNDKKNKSIIKNQSEIDFEINNEINHLILCTFQLSLFSHLNKDGSPKNLCPDFDTLFINKLLDLAAKLPDYIEPDEILKLVANFSLTENLFPDVLKKIEEKLEEKGLSTFLSILVEMSEENSKILHVVEKCKLRLRLLQIENDIKKNPNKDINDIKSILNNDDISFLEVLFDKIDHIDINQFPNIFNHKFELLGVCRDQALTKLEEKIKNTTQKSDKIKSLKDAKELPLFEQHRNHGFFKTIGRTNAVIKIDKMISETKGSVVTQLLEKVNFNRRNN